MVDISYFAAALGCGTDASVVIFTVILSPTFGTYAPTPKAERSNEVVALKPIDCALVIGCSPCLFSTASKTTGFVTFLMVRSPVILGGVSKSMLKQSRLNFDKIEKCE